MDDAVDAMRGDDIGDQALVGGIADEQRDTFRDEGRKTGREIVNDDDAFAGIDQRVNRMASNIAGTAGDEHGHDIFPRRLPLPMSLSTTVETTATR